MKEPCSQAVIIRHDLSGFQSDSRIQVLKEFQELHTDESLSNSRIIIGIGRGVKRKETVEQSGNGESELEPLWQDHAQQ